MKIDKLVKIVMIIILAMVITVVALPISVNADNSANKELEDLLGNDDEDEFENMTGEENKKEDTNEGTGNKTENKPEENKVEESKKENNVSTYDNSNNKTDLPKAGIEDWNFGIILIVVSAISGLFAIKKINEYKNI